MDSIKDYLTVGQELALSEPVPRHNNPSDCPISRKDIIALYLAFLTDNALLALNEKYGENHRNIPRSYTKPVFDETRDQWATDVLNDCANIGQLLADRFSGQWHVGIPLPDVKLTISQAAKPTGTSLVVRNRIVPEPVAAFASRLPDDASVGQQRRLIMVIDV